MSKLNVKVSVEVTNADSGELFSSSLHQWPGMEKEEVAALEEVMIGALAQLNAFAKGKSKNKGG